MKKNVEVKDEVQVVIDDDNLTMDEWKKRRMLLDEYVSSFCMKHYSRSHFSWDSDDVSVYIDGMKKIGLSIMDIEFEVIEEPDQPEDEYRKINAQLTLEQLENYNKEYRSIEEILREEFSSYPNQIHSDAELFDLFINR